MFDGNEAVFNGVVYETVDEIIGCKYCVFSKKGFECNNCLCTYGSRPDRRNVIWKRKETNMEKRIIELSKPEIVDGKIQVTIKYQSHIGGEFGNTIIDSEKSSFVASNGLELRSYCYPCYTCFNRVYTRGLNTKKNEPIEFPSLEDYNRFIEAVNEYNNYPFQPQIKEVTLDEIEKQLGYKIKIVNK